jgi:hypothetical protein
LKGSEPVLHAFMPCRSNFEGFSTFLSRHGRPSRLDP